MLELTLAAVTFCCICNKENEDEHKAIDLIMDHLTRQNTLTYQPTHYVWTDAGFDVY